MDVSEHPVRLLLSDDLERDRLTVFFRFVLAIPHFIWLALWSIVALLVAVLNWVAALILGRAPAPLYRFLAAYVRYVTQFYGYYHLVANPYPAFSGRATYPVDLTIAAPGRQSRWSIAIRAPLLLPAALIFLGLAGAPAGANRARPGTNANYTVSLGLLNVTAFLGWFASLARGRMPRGLRDAGAYSLSYGAQFWSYALLLTDRYPDSDPLAAVPGLPVRSDPIRLELADDLRRSRLTVFFRAPLAVPHLIWLELWSILAFFGAVLNWLVTLSTGRSPNWLHRFLAAYLRYAYHVYAFLYLIANPFPGFVGKTGSYPFEIVIAPRERQSRWKTGFRIILAVPGLILTSVYGALAFVVVVLGWFSSLARGRMPRGLRNAGALALRYQAQTHGYLLLLTDAYPYSGPTREAD
ncbi:MAG TPA: DUF4389 domain-containing protein [Solirubrobacteraceae bacterium]